MVLAIVAKLCTEMVSSAVNLSAKSVILALYVGSPGTA